MPLSPVIVATSRMRSALNYYAFYQRIGTPSCLKGGKAAKSHYPRLPPAGNLLTPLVVRLFEAKYTPAAIHSIENK